MIPKRLIVFAIIVFGLIFSNTFLVRWPRYFAKKTISSIVLPLNNMAQKTADFFQFLKNIKKLNQENAKLEKEKNELAAELARLKEVAYENALLKKEMETNPQLLPAPIILKSPSGFLKIVTIGKGAEDSVELNKAVVAEGILIGKITKVEKHSAEVSLITNPNLLIPVVLEESRGSGILRGSLSGLEVEDISIDTKIKIGENVLTSGLGNEITANILVGKTAKIISKESEIFQKVIVFSPVNFDRLETVFVVK